MFKFEVKSYGRGDFPVSLETNIATDAVEAYKRWRTGRFAIETVELLAGGRVIAREGPERK